MTLPKESELPLIKSRAEARQAALKRLIEKYQEEYDEMHSQERLKRGLAAMPDKMYIRSLETENERLRALLAEQGLEVPS